MSVPTGVFVGLATLDVIHLVQDPPGPNQKVTARRQFVAAGGPAANAAVTFAASGGRAVLLTVLGRGPVADLIRADLERFDVEVLDAGTDLVDAAPVSSIVVAATGERSIVSVDAGTTSVGFDPGLLAVVDLAQVVLVDGHHAAVAIAAVQQARRAGIPAVVDAGRWKPVFDDLVSLGPEFVCSADLRAPGTDSVEASAAALRARGLRTVVTTRGADPVLWWHGVSQGEIAVPATEAVDTSGAGDAFHGAYAHRRALGAGVPDSIRVAVAVAATKVSVAGPRDWLSQLAVDHQE